VRSSTSFWIFVGNTDIWFPEVGPVPVTSVLPVIHPERRGIDFGLALPLIAKVVPAFFENGVEVGCVEPSLLQLCRPSPALVVTLECDQPHPLPDVELGNVLPSSKASSPSGAQTRSESRGFGAGSDSAKGIAVMA
jgi:hypothetical protein